MSGGKIFGIDTYYSDIWKIDLETLEWVKLDYSLKTGLFSHRMSIVDDCYLYSFGSFCLDLDFLNAFERFTLQLPSIYRLCLESFCRSPNVGSYLMALPSAIVNELNFDNYSSFDI
ncbi:hypothetical protein RF11_09164 [Thelohanellus kitauei]|uniref:Kelch domain-containing protein 10 n=1 Tax=Thelohanellus kitauei TaxID=669202 RepID=A0A0C2N4A9_THEKT|nr:hypothetical protein RF11_09164 [Thelohanellus kitauei]